MNGSNKGSIINLPVVNLPHDALKERTQTALFILVVQAAILLIMILGDAMLKTGRPLWVPAHVWAALDVPVHSLLGLMIGLPLYACCGSRKEALTRLSLAALAPAVIDLDHFAAAGSFSLYAAANLPYRPATHSLIFVLISALIIGWMTRSPAKGLLVGLVLVSHMIRDASGGGIPYLLWPFHFTRLNLLVCYALQVGFSLAAWGMVSIWFRRLSTDPSSPGDAVRPAHPAFVCTRRAIGAIRSFLQSPAGWDKVIGG